MTEKSENEHEPRPHEQGFLGTRLGKSFRTFYTTAWHALLPRISPESSIFDSSEQWDVCVVLDSCRVDALQTVAEEFDFLPDSIDHAWSVGSMSGEWVARTFSAEYSTEIKRTSVVTANSWYHRILEERDFSFVSGLGGHGYRPVSGDVPEEIIHAWAADQERGELHPLGGPAPDLVTKYGLHALDQGAEKLVFHFMPPHQPYVGAVVDELDEGTTREDLTKITRTPFSALADGVEREDVWKAYLDNLRYGLSHVDRLLKNLDDFDVLITADHGELFGEWGLSAHPPATPHPDLRRVPWVLVNSGPGSIDSIEGEKPPQVAHHPDQASAQEQLKALGYVE